MDHALPVHGANYPSSRKGSRFALVFPLLPSYGPAFPLHDFRGRPIRPAGSLRVGCRCRGVASIQREISFLSKVEVMLMPVGTLVRQVLQSDSLTRGLEDPEARILVEWLVEKVEHLEAAPAAEAASFGSLERLTQRARAI